jgi:hypothetical protein
MKSLWQVIDRAKMRITAPAEPLQIAAPRIRRAENTWAAPLASMLSPETVDVADARCVTIDPGRGLSFPAIRSVGGEVFDARRPTRVSPNLRQCGHPSDNLVEPFRLAVIPSRPAGIEALSVPFQPATVREIRERELPELLTRVPVSRNRVTPINPPRTYGKAIVPRGKAKGPSGVSRERRKPSSRRTISREHSLKLPDSMRPGMTVTRGQPFPWDLLDPVLNRPLRLDDSTATGLPSPLYPFQVEGVRRLVSNSSFLLADEMGTGKTVMTTVALRILIQQGRAQTALVVCPKSVIGVWAAHLEDWAPMLSVCIAQGEKADRIETLRTPCHVCITTYDSFSRDIERSTELLKDISFDVVVLDEAHSIKNPGSLRSRSIRKLEPAFRWALTGTPVQNQPSELAALFQFVKPALGERWQRQGVPPPETAKRLIEPHFLRRCKKDVFPELPAKIYADEWLLLDRDQQAAYEETLSGADAEGDFTRMHVFALIGRLNSLSSVG